MPARMCSWKSRSRPTIADAEAVVKLAREKNRKLVLGYILRVHPSWMKFIELGQTLGKPLVMRLNLNQQSNGPAWSWHKNLIDSPDPDRRLRRALCRRDVPADRREAAARARHRRKTLGGGRQAELRPPPRHLRRRIGRLVRGRLGSDDERGSLLREGCGRAERRGLHRRRSFRGQGPAGGRVGFRRYRPPHQDRRHPLPPCRGRAGQELRQEGRDCST